MFIAAQSRIDDPAISREIGMLLGNDLGQMRVQFNVKTYVVEPVYRDDGLGLWDFGENCPAVGRSGGAADRGCQNRTAGEADDATSEKEDERAEFGGARPVAPDQRGMVIAKYPEWDSAHGIERPEWTIVREVAPRLGEPRLIEEALDRAHVLRSRIGRLIRGVRIGRKIRLNRQHEGHDLDIDAVLDAGIALRTGREPDPRVFRSSTSVYRDLSALLLIDVSESTRDRLASGATILDVERLAVSILAEAMGKLGDPFSLLAFASDGREDVKMTSVKSFDEPYDRSCKARLAGLTSGLSTRLGAALRHAGRVIGGTRIGAQARHRAHRRRAVRHRRVRSADAGRRRAARRGRAACRRHRRLWRGARTGRHFGGVAHFRPRQDHDGSPRRGPSQSPVRTLFPAGAALSLLATARKPAAKGRLTRDMKGRFHPPREHATVRRQ